MGYKIAQELSRAIPLSSYKTLKYLQLISNNTDGLCL